MKDPTLPLQSAIAAAVVSELTTQGYASATDRVLVDPEPNDALPYVVLGNNTVLPFLTKTTEGGECTQTLVAWAATWTEANQVADYALQCTTDRDAPLTVTGYTCERAELDFRGPPIREEAPGTASGWYWGIPVRIRYRLVES